MALRYGSPQQGYGQPRPMQPQMPQMPQMPMQSPMQGQFPMQMPQQRPMAQRFGQTNFQQPLQKAIGPDQQQQDFTRSSPAMMALLQRHALRTADSQRHRGSVMAQMAGLDPMAQRQALVDSEGSIAGNTANFLNESQFQDVMGNRDYGRQMQMQQRGFDQQRQMAELQARLQRQAQGGVGGMIGGLVGTGLGAFAGGYGASLGGKLGGGIGGMLDGGGSMGDTGWKYPFMGGN